MGVGITLCLLCRAAALNDTAEPYYLLMELTGAEEKPTLRALREIPLDQN
jgi:hypothetical protein